MKPVVWLLNDGRVGNFKQLQAIAFYLAEQFEVMEKQIVFTKWIFLPNFLRRVFDLGIDLEKSDDLQGSFPDLVLSVGRRTAPIACAIKRHSKNKTKIMQIMRPNMSSKFFDFIVTPKHDEYEGADLEIITTPNLIAEKLLDEESKKWQKEFQKIKKNKILLIIGGDAKRACVAEDDFRKLSVRINEIAKQTDSEILITTSRRTGKGNENLIEKLITVKKHFFKWGDKRGNPYLAMLDSADQIVVTGDSMSMCAEACSTGKPVFIYYDGFGNDKHQKSQKILFENNFAAPFFDLENGEKNTKIVKPLNEAKKITEIIFSKFQK